MAFFEKFVLVSGLTLVAVTLVCAVGIIATAAMRGRAAAQHRVLVAVLVAVLLSPIIATGLSVAGVSLVRLSVLSNVEPSLNQPDSNLNNRSVKLKDSPPISSTALKAAVAKAPAEKVVAAQAGENLLPTADDDSQSAIPGVWARTKIAVANTSVVGALIAFWFAISGVMFVRLCRRILVTRRMLALAAPVSNEDLVQLFRKTAKQLQQPNLPRFLVSSEVQTPIAAGILCPAVVVPSSLFQQLKEEEITDVLTHELAHVARRDSLVLLLQSLALSLFWPVPLLHVCNRWLNSVREDVCDNFVLAIREAVVYGETLLKVASLSTSNPTKQFAVGMTAMKGSLESRIGRIVSDCRDRSTNAPQWLGALSLIVLLLTSSLACGVSFATHSQDDEQGLRVVSGVVLGVDGNPVADCKLTYTYYSKTQTLTASSNSNGQFEFRIPEAIYGGRVAASNSDLSLVGATPIDSKAPPVAAGELKVQLEECLTTTVKVQHNGEPVSGAVVLGDYDWKTKTDANGLATLRVPFSDPIDSIWVFHTQGVAFWYPTIKTSTVEDARKKQPGELTLDLLPTRTCTAKVSTEDGEPVNNFEIFPFFRIEGDSNRKFFPMIPESYAKTNEAGVVEFNWIPKEPVNWFIPSLVDKKNYRKVSDGGSLTEELRMNDKKIVVVKLQREVEVSGKAAVLAGLKGTDLEGILIRGMAYDGVTGYHEFSSFTNSKGRFEAKVVPGLEYHVVAMGSKWSSDVASAKLVDKSGNSNAPLELKLYPSTQVTINVVQGKSRTPVLLGDVLVKQDIKIRHAAVSLRRYLKVDSNGQVKFGIGKGEWTFTARNGKSEKQISAEIKKQDSLTLDAHYEWAGEQQISGKVVDESGKAVEKVDVTVVDYRYQSHKFKTESGARGEWEVSTDAQPNFAILAFDQEKKRGGMALVHGPTELPCSVKLTPVKTLQGQLQDLGGKPLEVGGVELMLIHETKYTDDRRLLCKDCLLPGACPEPTIAHREIICAQSTTNAKGQFEFQALTGVDLKLALKIDDLNSRNLSKEPERLKPGEPTSLTLRVDPAVVSNLIRGR